MLLGNLRRVVLIALVLLGIAGCTQRAERADIRIIGTKASGVHFEIGKVRSKLATDAVDETVRINPRKVYVHSCLMGTPAERLVQLKTELEARIEVPISYNMEAEGCPQLPGAAPRN